MTNKLQIVEALQKELVQLIAQQEDMLQHALQYDPSELEQLQAETSADIEAVTRTIELLS